MLATGTRKAYVRNKHTHTVTDKQVREGVWRREADGGR